MSLEDFTDATKWTETDPDTNLSQTVTKSQWTALERQDGDCQLLGDNGVGSIPAIFDYFFELEVEALEAGDASVRNFVHPLAFNNVVGANPLIVPYIALSLWQDAADDTVFKIRLSIDGAVQDIDDSINLDVATLYYCELERTNVGENVLLFIRTGSHAGVLVDTLSCADVNLNRVTLRYIHCPCWVVSALDPTDWSTGYVQNLDLDGDGVEGDEIGFMIGGVDESDHVLRADIWREAANGIGRWEVILDPRGLYWPAGAWVVDTAVEIQINGSLMMRGYLDDVKPFRDFRDISGYDTGTTRHTGLWKLTGRDYGMDLAQMYFTAAAGDYQYTRSGDIIRGVILALVAAGIPCEITPHAAGIGTQINYDWAPRTYLTHGFREIAELDNYDFYVQHNALRTFHYFAAGAVAEDTTVVLMELTNEVPTATRTPILELDMGETLGFKLKNYIEVSAGFLDDHWTEVVDDPAAAPNASPDWIAGPDSTVTEEYNIYMTPHGKGAIRCTQNAAPAGPMYMRCPIPVGNDPKTGLDLRDESHIRYLVYQEDTWDGAGVLFDNVSVALVDDRAVTPRIIFYQRTNAAPMPQDQQYTGALPDLAWREVRAPIGQDTPIGGWGPQWQQWALNWEGAPYIYPGGAFNWSNVQQIVFTSYQTSLVDAFFIIDGLQIPTVEVVSRSSVAAEPPGWRMKHFKRTDIYDHFVLDDLTTKIRDQYRYPLQTLKVTTMGQVFSKYAGQGLEVCAPAFGIGGPTIATTVKYRIFKLHHSVVKNSAESAIPGYTYLTDYELIKHAGDATPQLLNPTRMEYNLTPTEAMLREFRLEQKYLNRGKYRRHL